MLSLLKQCSKKVPAALLKLTLNLLAFSVYIEYELIKDSGVGNSEILFVTMHLCKYFVKP